VDLDADQLSVLDVADLHNPLLGDDSARPPAGAKRQRNDDAIADRDEVLCFEAVRSVSPLP